MVKLKVIEIQDFNYTLENVESKQQYKFQIRFFDLKDEIVVGDLIMIHEELLDKGYKEYSKRLQFGPINEPYGRKIESKDHVDLVCVVKNGKGQWLKRFFG